MLKWRFYEAFNQQISWFSPEMFGQKTRGYHLFVAATHAAKYAFFSVALFHLTR